MSLKYEPFKFMSLKYKSMSLKYETSSEPQLWLLAVLEIVLFGVTLKTRVE